MFNLCCVPPVGDPRDLVVQRPEFSRQSSDRGSHAVDEWVGELTLDFLVSVLEPAHLFEKLFHQSLKLLNPVPARLVRFPI